MIDTILELWMDNNELSKNIATNMIIETMPDSFECCLQCLNYQNAEDKDKNKLAMVVKNNLFFLKKGYKSVEHLTTGKFEIFSDLYNSYITIIHNLKNITNIELIHVCYKYFEGIRQDLKDLFPNIRFNNDNKIEDNLQQYRQLMIFLTGSCNLNCSYCFSKDIDNKHIDISDLKQIIQWAYSNQCDKITLCGGEPLMYRHIGECLDLINQYGMTTYFASNLTTSLKIFTNRQLNSVEHIMAHLSENLWDNKEYMKVFADNIIFAHSRNINITARANITKDLNNIEKWFEIIEKFNINAVNIALTFPSQQNDNNYIEANNFEQFQGVVKKCIEIAKQLKINISFAKPIPPCVFDKDTANWLIKYDNFRPFCNVFEDNWMRNICIDNYLNIKPCLAFGERCAKFSNNLKWNDLREIAEQRILTRMNKKLFDKCDKCFLFNRKLCQGACLSYK